MTQDRLEFGALPVRAFGDRRLTASHFRLLGVIAYHDRFSANGIGCYVRHSKLAAEAVVDYTNVTKLAADLAGWGYIKVERNSLNRRLRVYRLIYNGNQATVGETTKNGDGACDVDGDQRLIVGESANNDPSIVGVPKGQVTDDKDETALNILGETLDKKSCEAAVPDGTAPLQGRQQDHQGEQQGYGVAGVDHHHARQGAEALAHSVAPTTCISARFNQPSQRLIAEQRAKARIDGLLEAQGADAWREGWELAMDDDGAGWETLVDMEMHHMEGERAAA